MLRSLTVRLVGRTIVFTARMIVSYGEAHGIIRAQKQPRAGFRASVKEASARATICRKRNLPRGLVITNEQQRRRPMGLLFGAIPESL